MKRLNGSFSIKRKFRELASRMRDVGAHIFNLKDFAGWTGALRKAFKIIDKNFHKRELLLHLLVLTSEIPAETTFALNLAGRAGTCTRLEGPGLKKSLLYMSPIPVLPKSWPSPWALWQARQGSKDSGTVAREKLEELQGLARLEPISKLPNLSSGPEMHTEQVDPKNFDSSLFQID